MISVAKQSLNLSAIILSIVIGIEAVQFSTLKYFRGSEYWLWYDSIDAESPVNGNQQDLWMVSRLSVYRDDASGTWTDVLRCRPWGVEQVPFGFQSVQKSSFSRLAKGENKITRWLYAEKLPTYDAECYVDSTVIVKVNEFIKHSQKTESSTFRIIPS